MGLDLGLGLGLTRGGRAIWTPERETGLTFDLDPSLASSLTLSGSEVTAATSRSGGSIALAKSGTGPALDAVNTIAGYSTLKTTAATGEKLVTTGGPTLGSDVGMSLYAVAQFYGSNSYPSILNVGSPAGASGKTVILGARSDAGFQPWAGCNGSPLGALGGTGDTSAHVYGLEFDSATGKFTLRVDGVRVAGPTSGGIDSSSTFPKGFGIAPQFSGFNGNVRLARAIYRLTGLDALAVRRRHEWYLAQRYGLTLPDMIGGVGDSLTFGTGSSNPTTKSYLAQLSTYLTGWSYVINNDGHPGATAASLASAQTSDGLASGARRNSIMVLFVGTNDCSSAVNTAPATTEAGIAARVATFEASGWTVLFGTLFPWDTGSGFGWVPASAAAVNAWIRSTYGASRIIEWASTPELQLVADAPNNNYDARYRNTSGDNVGHPTDAGFLAMARDAAPVIAAWRR